jgi:glycosyltransferase involved in cell wall biosynthesis
MHAQRGFAEPLAPLPYFVDRVDSDWQQPGPRPHERPYFLFVGRLEVMKGLQTLVDLWKTGLDFDLLVVGTGSYENQLRATSASAPRIKFLGAMSQRELGALYVHALACIVPSITYETFGIVILEAFARKTPVIVRDLGALPEVVQESGGGYTYCSQDELLVSMRRIAGSPTLRSELGENGYQAFLLRWSREAHLERYFGVLDETARRKFGYSPWDQDQLNERPTLSPVQSA